jgi:hypothetical protein
MIIIYILLIGFEYDTLAIGLKTALEKDNSAFSASNLINIDEVP